MGTFDFRCQDCGEVFEFTILGNIEAGKPFCLKCLSSDLDRLFSPPTAVGIGLESVGVTSENYIRPDKSPNPARMWAKQAYNFEKLEDEGKIPKVDDHIEDSIKAWTDVGYEL